MSDIRWLAVLPDPVTGRDAPVLGMDHTPRAVCAPDRVDATAAFRQVLSEKEMRLARVVSVLEWEERRREPDRPKGEKWLPPNFYRGRDRGRRAS